MSHFCLSYISWTGMSLYVHAIAKNKKGKEIDVCGGSIMATALN